MRWDKRFTAGVVIGLLSSGCRAATSIQELPRVDLQLQNTGNRGYLVGAPSAEPELKTTREMFGLTVEVPAFGRPAPTQTQGAEVSAPETEMEDDESAQMSEAAPGSYDTYVVQKGDSLWSIAAKHEIYGRATQWRRIFDANRDILKSPGNVRAGMKLKIPRGESESSSSGSTTYKK